MSDSQFEAEITSFFEDYSGRWNSQNYGTLAELWDREDSQPFYRPMEVERCITSWNELERYWNPGVHVIDGLWNVYTNLVPKRITDDVAVVLFDLDWDIKAIGRTQPMSGSDPGMAVLKRKPEGWRMVAYVEACMHPAGYVRKIFERQVRPGFLETLEKIGHARVADDDSKETAAQFWSVSHENKKNDG
jgi:hypothetical protein